MVETAHVRVRSNVGAEATATHATRFQAVRDVLKQNFFECRLERPLPRIEVTLLGAEDYDALRGENTAGFFARNAFGYIADMNDHIVVRDGSGVPTERIFQHELAHRFVAACFPATPIWLNEGIASYFETLELKDDVLRIGQPPYVMTDFAYRPMWNQVQGRRVNMVAPARLPPVFELVRMNPGTFYVRGTSDEAVEQTVYHYAGSWALVHFLELGEPVFSKRFHDYLRSLKDPSTDPQASFAQAFAQSDLQSRFDAYLRKPNPAHVTLDAVSPENAPAKVRSMSEAESELHWAWLWTTVGAKRPTIEVHLKQALKDPAQQVGAKALQALLDAGAGDMPRARSILNEARAAAPNNSELLALALDVELEMWPGAAKPGAAQSDAPRRVEASEYPGWLDRVRALMAKLRPTARTADELRVLARGDLALGDHDAALAHINQSIELYPSHWGSRVERARACMASGLGECTLAELRVALNLMPHDATRARERILEFERQVRVELKLPLSDADVAPANR